MSILPEYHVDSTKDIMSATVIAPIRTKPSQAPDADHPILKSSRPHRLRIIFFSVIALLACVTLLLGTVQKWLWMRQLGYSGVFWTLFSVKWVMFLVAFGVAGLFLWINLRAAVKTVDGIAEEPATTAGSSRGAALKKLQLDLSPTVLLWAMGVVSVIITLFFAFGASAQWDTYLRFRYGGSFGIADPLFGVDLGFYFFRLPFYELLQGSLTVLTIAALGILSFLTVLDLRRTKLGTISKIGENTARHIVMLLAILAVSLGWGFVLDHYELVYSTLGVVHGAGYAAAHVTRISLWIMVAASAIAFCLLIRSFFRLHLKSLAIGIGAYVLLYVVAVVAVPRLFESFVVQPSELSLELPYLTHYIAFTRSAYNLDSIQETAYPSLTDLTPAVLARNQDTIQNIRLWDTRPLLQTYQQTQAIRLYYDFYNVDTDRYHLPDGYHQVMLSTRELAPKLPAQAQTWVNKNLEFTHGDGLVMNFVSKTVGGGFPQYLIKNIPPESEPGLNISQPAIYYGEVAPGYKIVATGIKEFDYPKGNNNVYTSYEGTGGIPLDSLSKRLVFTWTQQDINILLTSYLKPQSKIQIWRGVQERVSQVAPFLLLDKDPYAVLSDGRLYWIQDAYTTSDRYPYSSPETDGTAAGMNYIRNSVKVVVDMYNGSVSFYVMDPKDPVLNVYRRAFPGVFKNLSELSPGLKSHLRYPQDLFAIQASQYSTFHMTDPQVFYNREDLWVAPQEKYNGNVAAMEPYYILMKLPGSDQLEYLIMTPFTPQNRDNMIAWLAARCDFPDYGKMLFYELPKDKLIYGPNQVSAMIDQSTTISQQLTLWDQKGSGVIRGKLVVIPIENAFLYVVPLYLRAEGTNFPQLKRVIVATGDKVVMEPTLDEALSALFGNSPVLAQQNGTQTQVAGPNLTQARAQLAEAQKAIDSLRTLLANPTR
jgi:uncharacterized membrane protein (UPF0182 family)